MPAVLDHTRALPQRNGRPGPTFAGRVEGSEGNLVIFDAGDVLHDAFAVGRPGVNAETEVRPRCHLQRLPPQSSSASRFTAGASGFLNFSQSFDRPER